MIAFKLAYRNLIGAGLRTWLNVFVLSLSYVLIIVHSGFLDGWDRQARRETIDWEIGGGQFWHPAFDPYDPFSFTDSHSKLPNTLTDAVASGEMTPILLTQASYYPQGRRQNVLLRGIDPTQQILKLPTDLLDTQIDEIPAVIGTRMAISSRVNIGDRVMIRWRDAHGTFDAGEIIIVGVFKSPVPSIDIGQIWIPLNRLQSLLQMPGEATLVVTKPNHTSQKKAQEWAFQDHGVLLAELDATIKQKRVGGGIMQFMLLLLAMLAIFDTQVLSVFRRQREIGTDIALGMTRGQVVRLFTIEGGMHGILAALMAAVYGIPICYISATKGIAMPELIDEMGFSAALKLFPTYSAKLVVGTVLIVLTTATIVSFLPARKISKMSPTDAIRGKIQ